MDKTKFTDEVGTAGIVEDMTYEDRAINGPAVIQIASWDVHFEECTFDVGKEKVFLALERPIHGAIDVRRVIFRRCVFRNVGVVGPRAFIESAIP